MDRVLYCDASGFEHVGELTDSVLRLRSSHSVARHEDYLIGISKLNRDVFSINFSHHARGAAASRCCLSAECPKQHVGDRTVHCPAHQYREYKTRKAIK